MVSAAQPDSLLPGGQAALNIADQGQPFDERGGSLARRRYQQGRLFLRGKNPVWVGRWREDIINADGSVKRVERSVVLGSKQELPTRRLAVRRLELLLARVNAPSYRPGRIATVAEFAERWRVDVLPHRKPATIHAAESHLRCHILPHVGTMKLDQLGREMLQGFVNRLSKDHPRKTVLNVLGTLSAMLNTARGWGYTCEGVQRRDLVLPSPGLGSPPRFFTAQEVRQIIAIAEEPYRTMFVLVAMTGIRAGELAGLSVDDLDFDRKLIYIRRSVWKRRIQTTKSKASKGVLPMPDELAETLCSYLRTWRPNTQRLLFTSKRGTPVDTDHLVDRKLKPLLDKLEIPRCGLHAFRHTHSSLLLETGASPTVAQAQLRHSDPRITLGIYGHVIGDAQRRAVEKVARILRPVAPKSEDSDEWIQ